MNVVSTIVDSVLLIDDNPSCNFIMSEFIRLVNDSIVVNSAESVEQALEILADSQEFPDVIYVDLNMPVFDGFDFIESFERVFFERNPECKLFMLTSSLREEDKVKALQFRSVKGFVSKSDIDTFLPETLEK